MDYLKKPLGKGAMGIVLGVTLILLGAFYYFVVFQPISARMSELNILSDTAKTNLESMNMRATKFALMTGEMEELRANNQPVAVFDNQKPVIETLNGILASSQQFNISFNTTINEEATMVRRTADISFTCQGYNSASQIIEKLKAVPFRCQINAVMIGCTEVDATLGTSNVLTDTVSGTVSMT
ncbi:MAG: hypothetical protein RR450_04710, partial [Oscillospiraceae bacterium]